MFREEDPPRLSHKITIKYSEDCGRYGVASEDISAGEVILVDTPTACCLGYNINEQASEENN